MSPIKFGTDGWRAIIGDEYTYANVEKCATAFAHDILTTYAGADTKKVVIGYDTRFSSDRFAQCAAETVARHGIDVLLFDRPAPTPACSFFVSHFGAHAGIMITASHNPPHWNGFKAKADFGGTAPPEQIARIEHFLANPATAKLSATASITPFNPLPAYIEQLSTAADVAKIRAAGLQIVVDEMHGAGAGLLNALINQNVRALRHEPNPKFPDMKQPEPIDENLKPLKTALSQTPAAAVGIAFDGDADRLGIVDENGNFMDAGEVFTILFHQLLERRAQIGPVACTITMSSMVDKIAQRYNTAVYRTPVGFKYVAPVMREHNCIIGGEESGGYAFSRHIPDRDGIAAALIFLEAMADSGKTPTALLQELHDLVGKHAYYRQDLTITADQKQHISQTLANYNPTELSGLKVTSTNRDGGLKINLTQDGWWLACRLSGTEPLIRIYAEAQNEQTAQELVHNLKNTLKLG